MEVKIEVNQVLKDGVLGEKRYHFSVEIPYGSGDIKWSKSCMLLDLDADTVKEFTSRLTQELENALKV